MTDAKRVQSIRELYERQADVVGQEVKRDVIFLCAVIDRQRDALLYLIEHGGSETVCVANGALLDCAAIARGVK